MVCERTVCNAAVGNTKLDAIPADSVEGIDDDRRHVEWLRLPEGIQASSQVHVRSDWIRLKLEYGRKAVCG
jgi:hypothetical protein